MPDSLLISVDKVKADKQLSVVIKKHKDVFEDAGDAEYNVLSLFLIRERLKGNIQHILIVIGTRSFWYDYLNLVPEIHSGLYWPEEIIEKIEDPKLKGEIKEAK